jgi:hypothetical protein
MFDVKIDKRFPLQVLSALVIIGIVSAYPLMRYGSSEVILAALVGVLLSTINVMLGFLAIEYSFEKSYTTFLKAVLGGMGVRMLIMLSALLVLIKVVGLHAVALTVSLLLLYLVFLVLEVFFIQRKVLVRNQHS